jgi:hypothetical protein
VPLPAVIKVTVTGLVEVALSVMTFCVAVPSGTVTGEPMVISGSGVPSMMVPVPGAGLMVAPGAAVIAAVKVSFGSPGIASTKVGTVKTPVV